MFKSAATKIAHNSTIPSLAVGNKDLRTLQELINAEKNVLISYQRLNHDVAKAAEALRAWGAGEGDDLGDTLNASHTLLMSLSGAFGQYASHEHAIRDLMKSIRTREEGLDEMKRRRKGIISKADAAERKLSKMNPEHKNIASQTDILNRLRDEIRGMDGDIMTEEAALSDFKRSTTRRMMGIKFGGLLECCETGTIIAEYGKLVISEIPEVISHPGMNRPLYTKQGKIESLVIEAQRCISEVPFTIVPSAEPAERKRFPPSPGGMSPGTPSAGAASGWPPPPPLGQEQSDYPGAPTGHFMDASDTPSYPESPTSPMAYPAINPNPFVSPREHAHETTDDFGVNLPPPGGPPNAAAAGRFATFPVKQQHQRGFSLRDDGPAPKVATPVNDREEESFSTAIEQALRSGRYSGESDGTGLPPGAAVPQYERGGNVSGPPPGAGFSGSPPGSGFGSPPGTGYGPPPGGYPPPSGPPPGVTYSPPAGPPPGHSLGPPMPAANPWRNSTAASDEDVQLAYAASDDERDRNTSHHVRFGQVSDVDDEMEKRARERESAEHERESQSKGQGQGQGIPPVAPLQVNHGSRSPPPPQTHENEMALNSAAALEVSREMEALGLGNDSSEPASSETERGRTLGVGSNGGGGSGDRDLSPLPPPSAPFARQSVPPTYTNTEGVTPAQSYAMAHSGHSPPSYSERSSAPSQSRPSLSISEAPDTRRTHSPASPSLSDYPRMLGPFNKSSTSVTTSGTKTISAAAFRRPPPRMDSSDGGVKMRLPSSPYPMGGRGVSPAPGAGLSRGDSLPAVPRPVSGTDDDQYDYLSAYTDNQPGDSDSGTPAKADYGSLGNPKVVNHDSEGGLR